MKCCTPDDLLQTAGLRITRQRRCILEAMLALDGVFCASDVQQHLCVGVDTATIYRFLGQLEKAGALRFVTAVEGVSQYELLCPHTAAHAHFLCERCHRIECLQPLSVRQTATLLAVPRAEAMRDVSVLYRGVCAACQAKEKE